MRTELANGLGTGQVELITQDNERYVHVGDLLRWLRQSPLGAVYADKIEESLDKEVTA